MNLKDYIYQRLYPWQQDKFSLYQRDENKLRKIDPLFSPSTSGLCPYCNGDRYLRQAVGPYDSEDFPCKLCEGKGWISLEKWRGYFNSYKEEISLKKKTEKQVKIELARIKKKLTKQELEFLKKHNT